MSTLAEHIARLREAKAQQNTRWFDVEAVLFCSAHLAELEALAAAAPGGDVKQAPGEAPQSGPKGNAQ